ncbi:Uncharacterised protein [Chlamydia trachomatis]|nr:Uncharacterised protein [Chlamydia trachomatis]
MRHKGHDPPDPVRAHYLEQKLCHAQRGLPRTGQVSLWGVREHHYVVPQSALRRASETQKQVELPQHAARPSQIQGLQIHILQTQKD